MKNITISGEQYQYEVGGNCNETGSWSWTNFYKGTELKPKWKFLFWKSKELIERPKWVFKIRYNIEDFRILKSKARSSIEYQIELLNRKQEIERGEII